MRRYILTINCQDGIGIVAAIANALANQNGNIIESHQFSDVESGQFFMRVVFDMETAAENLIDESLQTLEKRFAMSWQRYDSQDKLRVMILVSKAEHCLNDLLYRHRSGLLNMIINGVISNHPDLAPLVEWHGIPYYHLPVDKINKLVQEAQILKLIQDTEAELVILARYMQILSASFCTALPGRIINIHHSFLPGFKGARPYHQAHHRGVKLIGATAHYVTADLDEGPIIEQEVERVDHNHTINDLIAVGRDIEKIVLARAVNYHLEHRVFLNGAKTVVLR